MYIYIKPHLREQDMTVYNVTWYEMERKYLKPMMLFLLQTSLK